MAVVFGFHRRHPPHHDGRLQVRIELDPLREVVPAPKVVRLITLEITITLAERNAPAVERQVVLQRLADTCQEDDGAVDTWGDGRDRVGLCLVVGVGKD